MMLGSCMPVVTQDGSFHAICSSKPTTTFQPILTETSFLPLHIVITLNCSVQVIISEMMYFHLIVLFSWSESYKFFLIVPI